jgi:pimeloyl-ACP methyl ester carboxylesterase
MQNQPPLTDPAETLAEVRAHDQVMRYRRAGAGRPLVVLRAASGPDALWPELDEALSTRYRVITPALPHGCDDVAAWMGDFLEGVGLDRVILVAAEPCCLAALELTLLNADQVDRLVLVPSGSVGETGLDGSLATTLAGVPVPLLVVRRGLPAREALPLLCQFLQNDNQAAPVG